MDQNILVRNGFVDIPSKVSASISAEGNPGVATVLSNLASYGYTLDRRAYDAVTACDDLASWWTGLEKIIKSITGADRNMDEHVVYKNFPKEVLDMDTSVRIIKQFLIYLGVPVDLLREGEKERPPLGDISKLKVLTLADRDTPARIFRNLMAVPNRWSDNQTEWALELCKNLNGIVLGDFAFKENGIRLVADQFDRMGFAPSSGTDVLRVAAALSDGDISLREKVKFRNFKREERRRLLSVLDGMPNLAEDMAARPEIWKRLMQRLHPGDYGFENVIECYDKLYNKKVKSFSALIDQPKLSVDVLDMAATRPGEFLRRFHHFYGLFGEKAVEKFIPVLGSLTTRQLVSLRSYLRTINGREKLIYPPRSNWSKAQVVTNGKVKIDGAHIDLIDARISEVLSERLKRAFPEGMKVDQRVHQIKFQTNDQKLAEYGRGTIFDIPENITFIRSASYWQIEDRGTIWYDNGWNFFDENWGQMGACAWDDQLFNPSGNAGAIFSGDPVNSKELKGRACQMVDLYLDELQRGGVRYAVWNVLCYSSVKFSEAEEVLATLQFGENAETGNLYEPSRAQMIFPLKSEAMSSYVAYVDIKERKLVYMDVAFKAYVSNAGVNGRNLEEMMPAYVEYLDALPGLDDLLKDAPNGSMPVLYNDAGVQITEGRAFVFRPENQENTFDRVSVIDLLNIE